MIAQINPIDIVVGHLKTLGAKPDSKRDSISPKACIVFLSTGMPFVVAQFFWLIDGYFLSADAIGIIVSAASIIAGLLLNLLILIYTLVFNQAQILADSRALFIRIARHTFYNISFTILTSLCLVLVCLMGLANNILIKGLGNIMVFYFGPLVALSLLMVLKKCHKLVDFYFSKQD